MRSEVVIWLEGLFSDLKIRSPHGIVWSLDRAEPPLQLRMSLAEGPVAEMALPADGPRPRVALVRRIQAHIDGGWEVALPPCPTHGAGLRPVRVGDDVSWYCPQGDVDRKIGDYEELLWPPGAEDEGRAGQLLARRLTRRGVRDVSRTNVSNGVVRADVREGADETALRDAAAPFPVEIRMVPPVGWSRRTGPDGESISITNTFMHLARLAGRLRRTPSGGLMVDDLPIELSFDHRIGAPGEPLLFDADGRPFADEGDQVICGGGHAPIGPVRGTVGVFHVGRMTRTGES